MTPATRGLVVGILAGVCLCAAAAESVAMDGTATVGDAVATVRGADVRLAGPRIVRAWRADATGVTSTTLEDPRRHQYTGPVPDFQMTVNELATSSQSIWQLAGVSAGSGDGGAQVAFRYRLLAGPDGLVPELDRTFTLHPGSAVIQSQTRLVDHGALPLRIGATTLDQVLTDPSQAEVQAYHGGSDWRDDYRVVRRPRGAFDLEGQVARYDDGAGSGFFEVSGRRGGAMARAGRDADGRAWIGVDWARDIFDLGPLATDPPNYNQLYNPVYPLPVRERTVAPGGTLDLGKAWVGVYHGGTAQAAFNFADAFTRWVTPRFDRTVGINSFHPWSHGPGMSDPNLRAQVDRASALGVESFMLDDQWQGGPGGESGDWRFDPSRFPDRDHDGVPDFVAYVHSKGLKLGLWMSPAEFNGASRTYAAHPDWSCTPLGQVTAQVPDDAGLGAWDFTNSAFRSYLSGVIDRLVHDYDAREFKFDFMAWLDCGTHDYLDYEDAFAAWVSEQERRHPQVTFELDETNDQRLWAFGTAQLGPSWFDNGHLHKHTTQPAKLLHDVWEAAPWIAPSLIGAGLFDGTLKPPYSEDQMAVIGILTHITLWTDLTKLGPRQAARAALWFGWYRAHRSLLSGAAYELTSEDPIDGQSWAALQPWNPRAGGGVLVAVRQGGGPAERHFQLDGLDRTSSYVVRRAPRNTFVARHSGRFLAATGIAVSLPRPQSATVFTVTRVRTQRPTDRRSA